jgi:RNA recognition motif-containing protein
VCEARTKEQRKAELELNTYRFKHRMMPNNLIVRGIEPSTTTTEFEEFFAQFGEIKSFKLIPEQGLGFVCFLKRESANTCKQQNDIMLKGAKLTVATCQPKEKRLKEIEEKVDLKQFNRHKNSQAFSQNGDLIEVLKTLALVFYNGTQQSQGRPQYQRQGSVGPQNNGPVQNQARMANRQ